MKIKTFGRGKLQCKTYLKTVGEGWEVGVYLHNRVLFAGNFIHAKEAQLWWTRLNREIRVFSSRYPVGKRFPEAWFGAFLGNYIKQVYYKFVNVQIAKHKGLCVKALRQDLRRYQKLKRTWEPREKREFLKKVA
jgi:hypothetical protein